VEQQHPGEPRERRFARPAEEEARRGPLTPSETQEVAAATAAPPSAAIESPPTTSGAPTGTEPEIMTKLPRSRPERRSTRRAGATGQRRGAAGTRSASARKRTTTAKQATPAKPARGRREQLTDAAVQTATMPMRVTIGLARRGGRLIGRLR
jgi:hypothetical protein